MSQGRIQGSTSHDITECNKTSEEPGGLEAHIEELVGQRTAALQSANEELIALTQVKDEFVSNVSHELRTPITSLKLHQHLLRQHPEELVERLDIMGRETDRLAATIEQLLQLSRLDQGRADLAQHEVDLNWLVGKYVCDRAPLSQATRLDFEAGADLPPVMGDESLLGEVLEIFLTNAVNYTPVGGRITVRTCARCLGRQRVAGFGVSDTGPGIEPAEQARLFDRFFRGKAGRESSASGSGLGLAIAREIVDRHSGTIEVESSGRSGEGTTFMVWLPAKGE
jgi:signal transduction histidine kinase